MIVLAVVAVIGLIWYYSDAPRFSPCPEDVTAAQAAIDAAQATFDSAQTALTDAQNALANLPECGQNDGSDTGSAR